MAAAAAEAATVAAEVAAAGQAAMAKHEVVVAQPTTVLVDARVTAAEIAVAVGMQTVVVATAAVPAAVALTVAQQLVVTVHFVDDILSIARVVVNKPTSEPWLTLHYDEWICILKGKMVILYGDGLILEVKEGESCFISKGERFRPTFPDGNTEYIPVCIPAFKPERCIREEDGVSDVTKRLTELHTLDTTPISAPQNSAPQDIDKLFHMCQKTLWEKALTSKTPYFPPTFEVDGGYTHATAVPTRLIETANHFYTSTEGDWICVEIDYSTLINLGIIVRFEEAMAVGATSVSSTWSKWVCPHIYAGLAAHVPGVVSNTYPMKRDDQGNFLTIEGIL